MKVLQICNDFAGSKVHVSLVRKLDEKGVEQVVYCPVRDQKLSRGISFFIIISEEFCIRT